MNFKNRFLIVDSVQAAGISWECSFTLITRDLPRQVDIRSLGLTFVVYVPFIVPVLLRIQILFSKEIKSVIVG